MNNRQLFLNNLAQTSDFPLALEIERAEGVYLYATDGKRYMDLISGIGVSNIGHRHPSVVKAIKEQADKYLHLMVYGEYIQSPQVKLAEALVETLAVGGRPPFTIQRIVAPHSPFTIHHSPFTANHSPLNNVYFTNSGTEAIEGAMKLAKRYTGRQEIVSCFNAYHGATQGALSLSGSENFKRNYRPLLPQIRQIHHGKIADLEHITDKTAAVIIEVISAEAGVRGATKEYFEALRKRCNETQTLLILDEIQTGFGRTGTFWAFEQVGIIPDVLVCAKGMGGGMPIGAFIANEKVMSVFKNNPILGHITTFGGHPVSCAASLATLQVIQQGDLLSQVAEKEALFKQLLVHPKIKEVRNHGLLIAVEFDSFDVLKPIIDACIERGLITDWFLFCDNSMRIAPPLTISEEEIRWACGVIIEVLNF